ncbi:MULTISPECIES: Xaa-Pro peptidase family protein [Lactobacillus]|uniref:Aminopeptidase P family protein n=1 Tax=Lactobacillus xujianguonis TaxID=2495899 RepID=A0A437SXL3_9LACO|nr:MULTISPECIES: aminopeptidase P family protein [Lactobacillus]RVU71662.1 aminopeptidase P family protein [Lactobacillus xujianguonis]RVU77687.1 aminopeptidase P family protein [Lactobacillus xujianguonis]
MDKTQELLTLINQRINKVCDLIKAQNADAMIIFNQANYRYLTNFTGEEAQLILTSSGERILLSDSRFAGQIKAQAPGELTVIMKHGNDYDEITKALQKLNLKRVLVEGEFVSAAEYQKLVALNSNLEFEMCEELVERVRNVKDELEIAALRKAIDISMESFKQILPMIKPGVKERAIAAKLDYLFKVNGGDGPDFDTIVASGVRSAWAHGVASDKKLEEGDMIVIDFGSFYNGYAADITRTVALGKVDAEMHKIYDIVHEAQRRGIAAAVVGNTGADVDLAARDYIKEQGYGQYFGHGIGHGIGLEIHELCQPALPFRSQKLVNNMVHTVEPGIYLPDKGGVRIEDDVLIHDQTPETLSTLPKDELLSL